jgi:hypothetical protein
LIVSLPDIFKAPVRLVVPINVFEPVVNRLPVTVCEPINVFEPELIMLPVIVNVLLK